MRPVAPRHERPPPAAAAASSPLRNGAGLASPAGAPAGAARRAGPGGRGVTRSVVAVGALPGDVEFGCAGALAAHRAAGDSVTVLVLAGRRTGDGVPERRRAQAESAARALDCLLVWGRPAGAGTPAAGTVAAIGDVLGGVEADVVYAPAPDDAHPRRAAVAAAALSAARDSGRVLHYGSPSTGRFAPSLYVDISAHLDRKLAALACLGDAAVDPELVSASARHFGAQARVRFAEAFAPARFVWDVRRA
jgi:LmbE family N-acetylglucosaminyl deacetylase